MSPEAAALPDRGNSPALDRAFFAVNGVVSVLALAFLGWLLVVREGSGTGSELSFMPALNAALNTTSATCLVLAYRAIRRKDVARHRMLVVTAFVASALFLVGYVVYHYVHGDTRYPGTGALRVVYLGILLSHVLLSMAVVPLVLTSFYFALRGSFERHRKIARVTLPIWLYVSVTGVVIFLMLRAATG